MTGKLHKFDFKLPVDTFRGFPLMFKTLRSFNVLLFSQSDSARVRSVSRLSEKSKYCRFTSRWEVAHGITYT